MVPKGGREGGTRDYTIAEKVSYKNCKYSKVELLVLQAHHGRLRGRLLTSLEVLSGVQEPNLQSLHASLLLLKQLL